MPAARATSAAGSDDDGGAREEDHNMLIMADEASEDEVDSQDELGDEEDEAGVDNSDLLSFGSEDDLPELSFSSLSAASSPGLGPTTPPDPDFPLQDSFTLQKEPTFDFPGGLHDAFVDFDPVATAESASAGDDAAASPPFYRSPSPKLASRRRVLYDAPRTAASDQDHYEGLAERGPGAATEGALPPRAKSPTQAEMDAFFGFVDPLAEPEPALQRDNFTPSREPSPRPAQRTAPPALAEVFTSEPPSPAEEAQPSPLQTQTQPPSQSQSQSQSQKRPRAPKAAKEVKPVEREYYQLQPIPAVSPETGAPLTQGQKRRAIITSLQRLALSILSQITDNVVPSASPGPGSSASSRHHQPVKVKLVRRSRNDGEKGAKAKQQTIVFPRKCGQGTDIRLSGRELAALLKVIELIIDGLDKRVVSTKRDLFYRDVAVFEKQHTVDALVEDIAATLRVRRSDLNIVAAAKGLFAGSLRIVTTDGQTLESKSQGVLIPADQSIVEIEIDEVKWVLVVEKEAVFQALCTSSFLSDSTIGNGVLLTGKGYPDLATRELVKRLADELPSVSLLALVDCDPHGLEILSTYRFGSASLSFDAANLTVGNRLEWLGVKGSEWDDLGVDRDELLPLTGQDRKKAAAMMKREWLPDEWRRELEYMLHLGRKAEIQILSSTPSPSQQPSQGTSSSSSVNPSSSRLVEYVKSRIRSAVATADEVAAADEARAQEVNEVEEEQVIQEDS